MIVNNKIDAISKMKQLCGQTAKFDKKIVGKQFLLGKYFDAQKATNITKKQRKYTKSKIQRLLNIQEKIVNKEPTYQFYLPLHHLWNQYTKNLFANDQNQDSIFMKLLRADFHGAFMTILHSGIDSYIGLEGLIINESLKTYKIITKNNKILVILKNQIVFQVKILEKYYSINGNCLIYRSVDRTKHKFKFKKVQNLNSKFIGILMED